MLKLLSYDSKCAFLHNLFFKPSNKISKYQDKISYLRCTITSPHIISSANRMALNVQE